MNDKNAREDRLTLELLTAIDQGSDLSQRHLASRMGIALGLANSYLKRCVRKGYIKIREAPANRCLYYLTPKGFAEKARLTAEYLSTSLTFYRQAAESCHAAFDELATRGETRLVLCGLSDLAEIALLRARESPVSILGVYEPAAERRRFFGKPVWTDLAQLPAYDALLLTDLRSPLTVYADLVARVGPARVWVPAVLGIGNHAGAASG